MSDEFKIDTSEHCGISCLAKKAGWIILTHAHTLRISNILLTNYHHLHLYLDLEIVCKNNNYNSLIHQKQKVLLFIRRWCPLVAPIGLPPNHVWGSCGQCPLVFPLPRGGKSLHGGASFDFAG